MVVLGALVNGLLVFVGSALGLLGKRFVSQQLGDFLMEGLGLCTLLVAFQGLMGDVQVILVVVSVVVGSVIGHFMDIDGAMGRLGDKIQSAADRRLGGSALTQGRFSEGFVASTLIICTGSMAVVGSLNSGLALDHAMLMTKGVMDLVVVCAMAASMGAGVFLSGFCVFAYEAVLSLLASLISPVLTDLVISYISVTGSLLLVAVGLNMIGVTKIRVANMLPAIFVPMVLIPLVG